MKTCAVVGFNLKSESLINTQVMRSHMDINDSDLVEDKDVQLDHLAGMVSIMRAQLDIALDALEKILENGIEGGRVYAVVKAEEAFKQIYQVHKDSFHNTLEGGDKNHI